MASTLLVLTALSVLTSGGAGLSVLVGDAIDFQCVTEVRDAVEYLPNFQHQHPDGTWSTLFMGSSPRPGTDLSKWKVQKDDDSVFHYRLSSASLMDGGHYRCENVNLLHHPLNVISTNVECGVLPSTGALDPRAFRPVCSVEKSGPQTDDSEPALKWVVGTHDEIEKELPSNTTTEGQQLTLSEEHHGKVVSCVLDTAVPAHLETPNCLLGPLNITFDVKVELLDELHTQSCGAYELLLTGNPLPLAPLVELEDPSESVEMGVEGVEAGVVVRLRACELTGSLDAVLTYDGAAIKTISFFPAKPEGDRDHGPSTANAGGPGSGAVAAAVIVILVLGLAGGFGFYLLRRRQLMVKGGAEDEETGAAADDADAGEKAALEEVKDEAVEEKMEKTVDAAEQDEEEKKQPEFVVEKDKVVEAEAEEALQAKLSALEDVEGVKMIDDSINEGKDDLTSDPKADENVDV